MNTTMFNTILDPTEKTNKLFGLTYTGPCPWCGGTDRFHFWPNGGEEIPGVGNLGRYLCMDSSAGRAGCGRKGNMIDYLQEYEGLSFKDACERLGYDPQIILDYRNEQKGLPPEKKRRGEQAREITLPFAEVSEKWRETAWLLAYRHSFSLPRYPEAKDYLLSRGLTEQTIQDAALGFYPRYIKVTATAWGFEKGILRIPRGIIIPWFNDHGQVICLRFRRMPDDESNEAREYYGVGKDGKIGRYTVLYGSSSRWLYGGRELVPDCDAALFEGELDKLVAGQQATCFCVATGSTAWGRSPRMQRRLAACRQVLICFDADSNGAGDRSAQWWLDTLENARRWRPLWADANDMARDGVDLAAWLAAGLETETEDSEPTQEPVSPAPPPARVKLAELQALFADLRSLIIGQKIQRLMWDGDELERAAYLQRLLEGINDKAARPALADRMRAMIAELSRPAPADLPDSGRVELLLDESSSELSRPAPTDPGEQSEFSPRREICADVGTIYHFDNDQVDYSNPDHFLQRIKGETSWRGQITVGSPGEFSSERYKLKTLADLSAQYHARRQKPYAERDLEYEAHTPALFLDMAARDRSYAGPFPAYAMIDNRLQQTGMHGSEPGQFWSNDEWAALPVQPVAQTSPAHVFPTPSADEELAKLKAEFKAYCKPLEDMLWRDDMPGGYEQKYIKKSEYLKRLKSCLESGNERDREAAIHDMRVLVYGKDELRG